MFTYLPTIYGCFCVTMAELSSCDRDYMAHSLGFYGKYLSTSGLELERIYKSLLYHYVWSCPKT